MFTILLTNDDGIDSDGLYRLAAAALEFGEVWIVAPDSQRSAASHAISLHNTVDVFPYEYPLHDVKAFSCTGSPADCVRVGMLSIMPHKPDLVLSGINNGYNTASDIQYSGTAGAAFEAAFQECKAAALSEGSGPVHEVTQLYLRSMIQKVIDTELGYGQIVNINFPDCKLSECKGILTERKVSHGMFYRDRYKKTEDLPGGGVRLMVDGQYNEDAEEGTDFRAVVDKYVSFGIANNIS